MGSIGFIGDMGFIPDMGFIGSIVDQLVIAAGLPEETAGMGSVHFGNDRTNDSRPLA
jgi:hypothetical protein